MAATAQAGFQAPMPTAAPAPRAAPPAAPAIAPAVAPQTAAWGEAPDLWAFAHRAARSPDPAQRLEALYAARECTGLLAQQDAMLADLWGAPDAGERQVALQGLLARCHGFATAGKQANLDMLRQLDPPSSLADDLARASRGQADAQTLQRLIRSGSPVALGHGLLHAATYWARQQGLHPDAPAAAAYAEAAWLAACELGKPCGPQAWQSQWRCIQMGGCGQPWAGAHTAAEQAQIAAWRQHIVRAVRARDWAALGLGLL